jgi:hypothetical protein
MNPKARKIDAPQKVMHGLIASFAGNSAMFWFLAVFWAGKVSIADKKRSISSGPGVRKKEFCLFRNGNLSGLILSTKKTFEPFKSQVNGDSRYNNVLRV